MDSLENGQKEYVVLNISLSVREHLGPLLTNAHLETIGGVLVRNVIELTPKSTIGMKGKNCFLRRTYILGQLTKNSDTTNVVITMAQPLLQLKVKAK